ncbi:MAG: bacteriohopanetetrol glucosamine biosynthesis glycosyltransferase HpnI [Bryobacteraceae bacterium]
MIFLAIPAIAAAAYYLLAVVAAAVWRKRLAWHGGAGTRPPVSILKPVHGKDPRFYEAIRSHALQHYKEYEILFGFTNADDPAVAEIERLKREFPRLRIEAVLVSSHTPNAKVGVLAELARLARYQVLLVNDSDIVVEPGYLEEATAPLSDSGIGLVTCLYRARSDSPAAGCEALGIATEFAPSVMVARLLGQAEFALGSTMVFRAETLRRIGGFEAIGKYLADDYQLGKHIRALGLRIEFAAVVVETGLGGGSWGQVWRHQLRWSRTIRVSRPLGYFGFGVTQATVWALVAFAAGQWWAGAAALGLRVAAGAITGERILQDPRVVPRLWLIPVRDLFGFAVWVCGLFGRRVEWRDSQLELRADGTILPGPRKAGTIGPA